MDAAKSAVNKIIGRSGQHDTEVHETVNPAVTQETIKPHQHEEHTKVIDKEVHQDHYHTTVQPLQHKEVLPERHSHQQLATEEREIHHGDSDRVRAGLEREAAQFANTSTTHQTTRSQSEQVAAGEHVHHHVHENVQPVIHKETVQPEVVHVTRPVHETHHAQAEHHGISTLPTKTLSEFKELGGKLTGGSHRQEEYDGHPRPYNPAMQSNRSAADHDPASHDGLHGSHGAGSGLSGTTGTSGGLTGTHGHQHGTDGLPGTTGTTGGLTGSHGTHGSGAERLAEGVAGSRGTHGTSGGLSGTTGTTGGLTGSHGTHGSGAERLAEGVAGSHGTHGTGTSGTHVSSTGGNFSTGTGYGSSGPDSTGTALGGRTEGNTAGRALDAATGHSSTGHHGHHGHTGTTGTSGVGSEGNTGRGLEHRTADHTSTGGSTTHHDRGHADTSSSTNTGDSGHVRDDVQSPSQGKDPNLVETNTKSSGWKGEGVPGSHSAVFGLTPDGKTYDETSSETTPLKSHKKHSDDATGDTGSRAATGGNVAHQMNDPKVNEKGHGGPSITSSDSAKPGHGAPGGEQGFGQVRPQEHGGQSKVQDKLDPKTDADRDGKAGFMD